MKVVYVGQLDKWLMAPDHLGIRQGAEMMGWDFHSVEVEDPTVVEQVNDLAPDLVMHGNTDSLGLQLPSMIRPDATQIFWMLDYRTPNVLLQVGEWEKWKTQAPYLSAVTVSAKDHIEMWEKEFGVPTFFWPHGCYIPEKLEYDPAFDYDVLFMGGNHYSGPLAARAHLIDEIDYELKKKALKITFVNETDLALRNQAWADMPKYYHSSKVVLDISHFWHNPGYCSGRYWYTATFGACAVTKAFPGCNKFFPPTFKWYFDTSEGAVDCITNLLQDNEERRNTKRFVAEYAWKHHNYKVRFEEMLTFVERRETLVANEA